MCCSVFFFFKQKTAYEMRISDWSSDVCSSDLARDMHRQQTRADRVVIVTQQAQRYSEVLAEHGVEVPVSARIEGKLTRGEIVLLQGGLPEGWTVQDRKSTRLNSSH